MWRAIMVIIGISVWVWIVTATTVDTTIRPSDPVQLCIQYNKGEWYLPDGTMVELKLDFGTTTHQEQWQWVMDVVYNMPGDWWLPIPYMKKD